MKNRNFWRPLGGLALLVGILGVSIPMPAQEAAPTPIVAPQSQAPPPITPPTPPVQTPSGPPPPVSPQSPKDDRIFFALPNYLTVENGAKLPPLTTGQKFKTVAEGCFDPVEVVFIGIQAGIGQADNTNPTYHQGFVGYSRRFGTAYADA